MITRSSGYGTGTEYLVGSGYEGKNRLSALFDNSHIEIRFNSHSESSGAYIKDDKMSASIGIGAGLHNSSYDAMTSREKTLLSFDIRQTVRFLILKTRHLIFC